MCGIFGSVIANRSGFRRNGQLERSVERLFLLSESRGKEASGIALSNDASLLIYKSPTPASEMIRRRDYRDMLRSATSQSNGGNLAFIGHSRLVTDGVREVNRNNQPVVTSGIAGIHNGII